MFFIQGLVTGVKIFLKLLFSYVLGLFFVSWKYSNSKCEVAAKCERVAEIYHVITRILRSVVSPMNCSTNCIQMTAPFHLDFWLILFLLPPSTLVGTYHLRPSGSGSNIFLITEWFTVYGNELLILGEHILRGEREQTEKIYHVNSARQRLDCFSLSGILTGVN